MKRTTTMQNAKLPIALTAASAASTGKGLASVGASVRSGLSYSPDGGVRPGQGGARFGAATDRGEPLGF